VTTHNSARNQFVEAGGIRYAYRRFGRTGELPPILCMPHFIGTMDWWDPLLTDGLAKTREVILFDNRGVGLTSGETPTRIEAMADDAHAFIHALRLKQVDVLGFSIGGMVAQELALNYPDDVRKIILFGTGPRGGEGMQESRPDVVKAISGEDKSAARAYLFFSQSANGQAAARRFLERSAERKIDLDPGPASGQTMQAQGEALFHWGVLASHADYIARLKRFKQPALVANGYDDIMVPTINSLTLFKAIPRSQLILYPDSGHGALFEFAELFVQQAKLFFEREDF
jgi:pimeloyl-ACP methyl ester carboxylesterase